MGGTAQPVRADVPFKDVGTAQPHIRAAIERVATFARCPECGGARLNQAALGAKIDGRNIAECAAMQVDDLARFLAGIEAPNVAPALGALRHTLDSLVEVGLGYLSLDRGSATLSGGEAQRVKMVRYLGSSLSDVTYVFDEPTVGLHPHDVQRVNRLLVALRDKGNTVLVVEHEPQVIAIADRVVDMGPGAGVHGGTGRPTRRPHGRDRRRRLRQELAHPRVPRAPASAGDRARPDGDSRLETLESGDIHRPAQPDPRGLRQGHGVKPALFSANSAGARPHCRGNGVIYTDLAFMAGVVTICEACEGKRFTADVLEYRLRDANIADMLEMSVEEAADFFTEKAVRPMLGALADVGLGYVRLGQPLTTLSGGERQRIKLAIAVDRAAEVLVLDEPTTGLHMDDVDKLVGLMAALVERGRTLIVIEHDLDIVVAADWVIDMGPGPGHDGGPASARGRGGLGDRAAPREALGGRVARRDLGVTTE